MIPKMQRWAEGRTLDHVVDLLDFREDNRKVAGALAAMGDMGTLLNNVWDDLDDDIQRAIVAAWRYVDSIAPGATHFARVSWANDITVAGRSLVDSKALETLAEKHGALRHSVGGSIGISILTAQFGSPEEARQFARAVGKVEHATIEVRPIG